MTEQALRTAVSLELRAIHELTELGAPHCPEWLTDVVQDHCRALHVLSRELFEQYGVRLHYHSMLPPGRG